jgi:hypothetical protein
MADCDASARLRAGMRARASLRQLETGGYLARAPFDFTAAAPPSPTALPPAPASADGAGDAPPAPFVVPRAGGADSPASPRGAGALAVAAALAAHPSPSSAAARRATTLAFGGQAGALHDAWRGADALAAGAGGAYAEALRVASPRADAPPPPPPAAGDAAGGAAAPAPSATVPPPAPADLLRLERAHDREPAAAPPSPATARALWSPVKLDATRGTFTKLEPFVA